jgi:hypothetical protein
VPYGTFSRSDSPEGGPFDCPYGSARACAVERREPGRAATFPPGVPYPITRELAAGLAAEAVLLAIEDRQSITLHSSADAVTDLAPAVLAEGFVDRALPSERAVVEPAEALTDPSELDMERVQ